MKNKLNKSLKKFIIFACLAVGFGLIELFSMIPTEFFFRFSAGIFIGFCIWVLFKLKHKPERYLNQWGYFVMTANNELEHRHIAKKILARDLKQNEVVHHINGKKTDNDVNNLCLMDHDKHEFFHSWLSWKKEKSGKYPTFKDQKRILVEEYGGMLLESFSNPNQKTPQKPDELFPAENETVQSDQLQKNNFDGSKILFDELRKERKRLAKEKSVPAYMIFKDDTLREMAEIMPETDEQMLTVRGLGPAKFRMSGESFISVIRKFKGYR